MTAPDIAPGGRRSHECRHCAAALTTTFCDLGLSPLANSYVDEASLDNGSMYYPLHALVCSECWLVQLAEFESPDEIFGDYLYFSSYSSSWLAHAAAYVEAMASRFSIGADSSVLEIASNDGYLLQYFAERGVPVHGVEPAANVADVAIERGIPTTIGFFGTDLAASMASEGHRPDLIVGNNVLAHVPDLNDFVAGMASMLADDGVITMEFPHLLELIRFNQFDTIYHEHFSYFSLLTVRRVFETFGLRVFDVETLPTHGGSLRIFATHGGAAHPDTGRPDALVAEERSAGLDRLEGYVDFQERVSKTKRDLIRFLVESREAGRSVVGYGAPAKGNTLLNACGVGADLIEYTVDMSPHKQGRYLPGSRIPIRAPVHIAQTKPDDVLILPWNLRDEILAGMAHVRSWGGRFVVPIPELEIVE